VSDIARVFFFLKFVHKINFGCYVIAFETIHHCKCDAASSFLRKRVKQAKAAGKLGKN